MANCRLSFHPPPWSYHSSLGGTTCKNGWNISRHYHLHHILLSNTTFFIQQKLKQKISFQNSQLQSPPSSKFFFQWHISALCLLTRSSLHFISCQSGKAPKEGHVWYSFSILRKAHILSRYSSHLEAQACVKGSSSSFYPYTSRNIF